MHRSRLFRLLAILFAISLIAAACGDDDDTSAGDDGTAPDDGGDDSATGDDGEEPTDDGGDDSSAAGDDGEEPTEDDGGDDAAAGDDGAGDGGELTTPSNPDEGVTDDGIKVGWMGDLTGPTASQQAPHSHGAQSYFECLNERGGLFGRQIQYLAADDQFSAEPAAVNFTRLTEDERVLALVGMGNSAITTQLAPELARLGIPVIGLQQTIDAQLEGEVFFNTLAHYGDLADMAVVEIGEDVGGIENAVVMGWSLEVPSGQEYAAYVEESVTAAGGSYAGTLFLAPGATEATAQMVELQQAIDEQGVNYITVHGSPGTNLVLTQGLADAGITDIAITGIFTMASPSVWENSPPDVMTNASGFHSFLAANNDIEAAADMTRCAELAGHGGVEVDPSFAHGYLSAYIFEQAAIRAVEATGELTRASLTAALKAEPFDTAGITCEVDWTTSQHSPCGAAFAFDADSGGLVPLAPFENYADSIDGEYGIEF